MLLASLILALVLFRAEPAIGQTGSVRGFVTSADDGEAFQGVNIVLDDEQGGVRGMVSNRDGFFLIARVEPGRYVLRASFIGFVTSLDTLLIGQGDELLVNIALHGSEVEMKEVSVEAEREAGATRLTAGLQAVEGRDIELVPAPDVSGDLVSYLTTMPGVVQIGDRGGQLFVRGGEPTQNMTLLDGIDIFQPFHMLGFYSAFPAEIVSRADVYAGGFPARYMDKISSVIDVRTRNGNKRSFNASASASTFTGSAHIEGPLVRNRVSFLGAGRLSTIDHLGSRLVSDPLPYAFHDLFGKVHAITGENAQLSVTGLHTYDYGLLSSEDDFFRRNDVVRWRNTALGGRYLVAPRSLSVLAEILLSYSRLQSEFGPSEAPTRFADVEAVNTSLNMTYFSGESEISWGFFFRTPTTEAELDGLYQNLISRRFLSTHAGGYIESDIYLGAGVRIRPSIGFQIYASTPLSIEPRLRFQWDKGLHHWSGAVGIYRQHLVGLSDRRDATSVFTAWIETPRNVSSDALHLLLGYRVELASGFELSIEAFRKELDNIYISEWTPFPSFTTRLQTADGDVTGFDVCLELRKRRFYGYANYGLSSTMYEVHPDEPGQIDPGPFRPPHDRRHQVNVLGALELFGFDLNVRFQFGSGLPFTPVQGFDGFILMDSGVDVANVRGFPRVIYESIPYRAELPAYHRLDVTLERSFNLVFDTELTTMIGLLNAYDRVNLFAIDLLTAERFDQLPLVPVIGIKLSH